MRENTTMAEVCEMQCMSGVMKRVLSKENLMVHEFHLRAMRSVEL